MLAIAGSLIGFVLGVFSWLVLGCALVHGFAGARSPGAPGRVPAALAGAAVRLLCCFGWQRVACAPQAWGFGCGRRWRGIRPGSGDPIWRVSRGLWIATGRWEFGCGLRPVLAGICDRSRPEGGCKMAAVIRGLVRVPAAGCDSALLWISCWLVWWPIDGRGRVKVRFGGLAGSGNQVAAEVERVGTAPKHQHIKFRQSYNCLNILRGC